MTREKIFEMRCRQGETVAFGNRRTTSGCEDTCGGSADTVNPGSVIMRGCYSEASTKVHNFHLSFAKIES